MSKESQLCKENQENEIKNGTVVAPALTEILMLYTFSDQMQIVYSHCVNVVKWSKCTIIKFALKEKKNCPASEQHGVWSNLSRTWRHNELLLVCILRTFGLKVTRTREETEQNASRHLQVGCRSTECLWEVG